MTNYTIYYGEQPLGVAVHGFLVIKNNDTGEIIKAYEGLATDASGHQKPIGILPSDTIKVYDTTGKPGPNYNPAYLQELFTGSLEEINQRIAIAKAAELAINQKNIGYPPLGVFETKETNGVSNSNAVISTLERVMSLPDPFPQTYPAPGRGVMLLSDQEMNAIRARFGIDPIKPSGHTYYDWQGTQHSDFVNYNQSGDVTSTVDVMLPDDQHNSVKVILNKSEDQPIQLDDQGKQDTFQIDYNKDAKTPVIIQNTGNTTYKFENAQNASFTAVWGGAGGNNTYDFETGSPDGTVEDVDVCVVQIDGVDDKAFANLDFGALQAAIPEKYSVAYHKVNTPIVIINPAQTDKIEINGQIVSNPTPSIVGIEDEFIGTPSVAGQDRYIGGTISASGTPPDLPAVVGFVGTEEGSISGYYEDSTSHNVGYSWRSGPVSLDMDSVHSQQPYRRLVFGYDNNEVVKKTEVYGSSDADTVTSSFDDNYQLDPRAHTGDVNLHLGGPPAHDFEGWTTGGVVTGNASIKRRTQYLKTTARLDLMGFDSGDFGLNLQEQDVKSQNISETIRTDYKVKTWNQWSYIGQRLSGALYKSIIGDSPDLQSATVLGRTVTYDQYDSTDESDVDSNELDRVHLNISELERPPAGADNGGGGSNGGGSAAGSGSGNGSSPGGNQTIGTDHSSTTMTGSSTTTLSGNDDSVTATGSGGTVNFAGQRETATIGSGTVNLWDGASGTVTGDGNTVAIHSGNTLSVKGASNRVTVTSSGNTIGLAQGEVDFWSGAGGAVTGNGNTIVAYSDVTVGASGNNATVWFNGTGAHVALTGDAATATLNGTGNTLSVAGSGATVNVASTGNTITGTGATVNLWNNAGASVAGDWNTIALNAGTTLSASGAHDRVTVSATGNSVSVANGEVDFWNGAGGTVTGDGDVIATYDNSTVAVSGARATLWLNGAGSHVSLTGDNATATANGTGNAISVAGSGDTVNVAALAGTAITAKSTTVNLWNGAGASVDGTGNTIAVNANNTLSVTGASNRVTVNATGNSLRLSTGEVDFWTGSGGTIAGDGNTIVTFDNNTVAATGNNSVVWLNGTGAHVSLSGDNATATTNGTGNAVSVSGSGNIVNVVATGTLVTADATSVSLWDGAGATVTGKGNAIAINARDTLSVTGAGNRVTVNSAGNSVSLANGEVSFGNGAGAAVTGDGNKLVVYDDSKVTATGLNTSLTVAGLRSQIVLAGAAVDLQDKSSAGVTGDGDTFTVHGTSSLNVSGKNERFVFTPTPGSATIAGFDQSDTMQFDHATFANWQGLLSHASQAGADTLIHMGATDTVTLKNFALASLDQNRVRFV